MVVGGCGECGGCWADRFFFIFYLFYLQVRKFTITSVKLKDSVYPKAHTCFNRIELPLYKDYKQCKRYVTDAVSRWWRHVVAIVAIVVVDDN